MQEASWFSPALHVQRRIYVAQLLRQFDSISTIVDAGCAEGNTLQYLRQDEKKYKSIIGIDKDREVLREAESTCAPLISHYLDPFDHDHKRETS